MCTLLDMNQQSCVNPLDPVSGLYVFNYVSWHSIVGIVTGFWLDD
jgi:hypothetical protein